MKFINKTRNQISVYVIFTEIIRKIKCFWKSLWNQKVSWCFHMVIKGNIGQTSNKYLHMNCTPDKFTNIKYRMWRNLFVGRPDILLWLRKSKLNYKSMLYLLKVSSRGQINQQKLTEKLFWPARKKSYN